MRISVIGGGSWGTAISWLLSNKGYEVRLWARESEIAEGINTTHHNPLFLTDIELDPLVSCSTDLATVLEGTEAVVFVTPSVAVPEMADKVAPYLGSETPLVLLSKGIEGSGALLLDVLAEKLGNCERLAVLSGPNHAEEISKGTLSATVIASRAYATAEFFQELFATANFRVYTSVDTAGVQLCGAAKNIIAIACGLASGLGFGDNTAAMLMTRGLAEISRLVIQLGGAPLTCMGLAGMGDLIVTCTSQHSRNRSFGAELAAGKTVEDYQERTHMVVEGAVAAKAVCDLAEKHGVDMPICEVVRSIIWEHMGIEDALNSLIERSFKPEFY
ncbi:MAG: NAD(P)-dependent glycerol-3-phosphate dehydrogenase [Coriobacteriia bacterium]|nr:NAD(P)-dependent glycerol-3-phosphate dehydrogenase [Coriobacteriia bacterium]